MLLVIPWLFYILEYYLILLFDLPIIWLIGVDFLIIWFSILSAERRECIHQGPVLTTYQCSSRITLIEKSHTFVLGQTRNEILQMFWFRYNRKLDTVQVKWQTKPFWVKELLVFKAMGHTSVKLWHDYILYLNRWACLLLSQSPDLSKSVLL